MNLIVASVGTGNQFFCHVKVCNKRLYFLFDSGCSTTFIGKHVKGVESTLVAKDTAYSMGMKGTKYEIKKFHDFVICVGLEEKQFLSVNLGVIPLAKINAYYRKHNVREIDGILGADMIRHLKVDFTRTENVHV